MGGISEMIYLNINSARQGMFIKSQDASHPVLLFLHGGMPEYFLNQKYPAGLENLFTVIWWEQRGAGISYDAAALQESLTLDQLIADTLELTRYLCDRFNKEKIYLMAHCGGSFIGIQVVAKAPELYHAYIGVTQMVNQLQSEVLAYKYMLQQFKANGNKVMVQKLEAARVTMTGGAPKAYLALRDPAMHSLGIGTTHDMKSIITGIFLPSLTSREYTLNEKIKTWRAKSSTGVSFLWDRMLATDLSKEVPELRLPVYLFHGIYDYTCSYNVAKSDFELLGAPIKGFYTFEQSAHSPIFEEPGKTFRILQADVLAGASNLSDVM
jgi:pimeloyl-ACP methyl ester carboxylesterase